MQSVPAREEGSPALPPEPRKTHRLIRYGQACVPTVKFWMETETHVYAFSVAANILLSFFPFLIVMVSLCRYVLKWPAAVNVIYFALDDYFPGPISDFLTRNLKFAVNRQGPFQIASVLVLLITANGIFEPLEVALNRIWRCKGNRSFLKNQLVSIGLIFACGGLLLLSTILTAFNHQYVQGATHLSRGMNSFLDELFYKIAAIPISMLMLFLIYWLLPNCKIQPSSILPTAIVVGLLLELLKYVNLLTWPYFRPKFALEYGPFDFAATLVIWGFLGSMVVLGGAEWAARRALAASDNSDLP